MRKIYYVYHKENNEVAICLSKPKTGKVIGIAGSLDGAKQIMNDARNAKQ